MNTIEKLLKMDKGQITLPSKEITIQLAKLKNEEITFVCKAIDPERMSEIQEEAIEIVEGGAKFVNSFKVKTLMIIESCDEIFKNKDLQKHFNSPTPVELLRTIMLNGEIDDLYAAVQDVNGYEKDLKKKKN